MNPQTAEFAPPDDAELFTAHLAIVRSRYEAAMAACGLDTLVVDAGAPPTWYRDDISADWRVNPHFRLFTPLEPADGCTLVLRPGMAPVLLQLAPADFWHLPPRPPSGAWTASFEIEQISADSARETRIADLARGRIGRIGPGTDAIDARFLAEVDYQRARKTAYELTCLRRASVRAALGHRAAVDAFRAGASEYEIHLAYLRATAHEDAELPYRNIVALDTHGAVLHYQFKERAAPHAGAVSFLIDAGADVGGYAADVTRSYAAAAGPFADLLAAMESRQQAMCAAVRPGVSWPDLHRDAHRHVAEILVEAGLARASADALMAEGATHAFLPHGLGHLLGTQTHDAGGHMAGPDGAPLPPPDDFPTLRLTRTVEADWVVTVEPGLYFLPMLLDELRASPGGAEFDWAAIEALMPFGGIRIEDNVRAVEGGIENLTRDAFAALETTA